MSKRRDWDALNRRKRLEAHGAVLHGEDFASDEESYGLSWQSSALKEIIVRKLVASGLRDKLPISFKRIKTAVIRWCLLKEHRFTVRPSMKRMYCYYVVVQEQGQEVMLGVTWGSRKAKMAEVEDTYYSKTKRKEDFVYSIAPQ